MCNACKIRQVKRVLRSHGREVFQNMSTECQEVLHDLGDEQISSPSDQIEKDFIGPIQRGCTFLDSSTGFMMVENVFLCLEKELLKLAALAESERGRASILQDINSLGPTFLNDPGENGYTRIFMGGKRYRISRLRTELLRRNTSPNPEDVPVDVVTVAVSYKHYWQNDKERISCADFEAIASFIEESLYTRIRFWIDTKLPPTKDGSFERWLKRGVSPYSRYLTLICPSASASQYRFWIASEKYIAMAGRGVFYTHQDDILYDKAFCGFNKLAKFLLKLVIGEEELPPGVNKIDEQKVYQWALGILGSLKNDSFNGASPFVSALYDEDFCERTAINYNPGRHQRNWTANSSTYYRENLEQTEPINEGLRR